jgi:hypothetical protein
MIDNTAIIPIRARLDRIKCSSDGIYLSGHNLRAGLAYALGIMGSNALDETEDLIRLVADGKTLTVQSTETLSNVCQDALIQAWSVAVVGNSMREVDFRVIPTVTRKGENGNG